MCWNLGSVRGKRPVMAEPGACVVDVGDDREAEPRS
jgi:hypothetical protein